MKKPTRTKDTISRGEKNRMTRMQRAHTQAVSDARSDGYAAGLAANPYNHEKAVYESSIAELQRRLSLALATPPLPAIDHGLNKLLSPILAYKLAKLGHLQNAHTTATVTLVVHNGEAIDVEHIPLIALTSIVGEMKRFGYG